MVDKLVAKLIWGLAIIGTLALAMLALGSQPAKSMHDQFRPLYTYVRAACLDQEITIRLVQSIIDEDRQKMYAAAQKAGVCKNFPDPLNVVFHKVVAEGLLWDGDLMVVVEFRDVSYIPVFSWYTQKRWTEIMDDVAPKI